jgi:hypothetical protein
MLKLPVSNECANTGRRRLPISSRLARHEGKKNRSAGKVFSKWMLDLATELVNVVLL